MIRTRLAALLVSCAALPAQAALPNPLAEGLRHCAGETDQAKRLTCFDALAASLPKVETDQFGLTADVARKREPAVERAAESKEANAVLPGKIVGLRTDSDGRMVFTLDNQQVWRQSEGNSRFQFAVGDVVHIEHGAMGTFWLAADKARKTRVKRIS